MENIIMYSFIVPIYNVEQYLAECIESLLRQRTKYRFEIILVNDGSTDRSGEIAEDYAKKNKNIKLIQKKNGGLASARNEGIRNACGKWIIFVDSDDYLDDSFLEETDSLIVSLKVDECIIVNNLHVYEDGTNYIENGVKPLKRRTGNMMNDLLPIACGKVISREIILKYHLFFQENIYYEDIALFPYMCAYLCHYIYINKPLYVYRQRAESISHERNLNKMQDAIMAVESARRRLQKAGKLSVCYEEFEFYVITFALTHMCAEVIEVDPQSMTAKKILRYVETYFLDYADNQYIPSMSARNRGYLWLIRRKKFCLLYRLIHLKKNLKHRMEKGVLRKLYLAYKKNAI